MLFSVLRSMLWQEKLPFSVLEKDDFVSLMTLARGQTVQGLMCDALLKNNCLQKDTMFEAIGLQNQITQQNMLVNHELAAFVKELENHNIKYIIVKGQTIAVHYPNSLARMPGDVDMYFSGENFNKVREYVEKTEGISLEKYSDGKHVEFIRNGVIFELHDKLSQFSTRKHQRYFNQFIDDIITDSDYTVKIDDVNVSTLPPTYNILYTFVHLFFHLTAQGIGLRQFCDLAMLMSDSKEEEVDIVVLEERLKELGLMKAFKAVGAVLVDIIGLDEKRFPFMLTDKDRAWGDKILKNVMERGNFGRNVRKVKSEGLLHSIESGYLVAKQAFAFMPLAPVEVFGRFFSIGYWFTKRLSLKN